MARKLWARHGLAVLATGAMAVSLAACGGGGAGAGGGADGGAAGDGEEGGLVGVAMPTQTYERWIADGDAVKSGLEEAGYDVDLQFAGDDIPTQQQQIDAMINKGAEALIIASIDGTALGSQLEAAAAADIPVISYDRLIRDSENVDFYVTFDNEEVGVQQGTSLLTGLGILDENGEEAADAPEGPFNIEIFAGSPDDNNAGFFFDGAMSVLQPYLDDGTLVVPSKQTDFGTVAIQRWEQEGAQSRMEDLLTSSYSKGEKTIDGVLAPADVLSRGVITALSNSGYGKGDLDMPVITGQDAEAASAKLIEDGKQYSTIFKDTRLLAEQAVIAATSFLEGNEPEANDTETYDNGVKVVPSFLLPTVIVTADNLEAELIESGYLTEEEVASGQTD
ncbi:monosaccharide ABC transporter substrate-binding protein, CUT2 family (TC 3.A.1.2.-) [Promicromonospora umidemergens]|uniref:Sugar ABC transporter substrate-binding protein n=1 Tax=Promicromonospora umidemergens TaxID=629679 RepID=A0ABP8X3P5_9MICO|nr:multiple monosaccharide ABC transporter substrate-binding protein [Promicromonospora umidemergens]MCP2286540.1 monosaccharide ABC transporter substrate-binding protein, CUT2 family (TC 3.A.1.2.-) [Promicromonospora umidemergens]